MAVARAAAGTGLGNSIPDAAVSYASPGELRLDCRAGSTKLAGYYTRAGFEDRGVVAEGNCLVRRFSRAAGT